MDVSYVSDIQGNQTAVIIGIAEWEKLLKKQKRMKAKLDVLTGLQEAANEVNEIKKGKLKKKTLRDFLIEN